ncbi:hypothetical protein Aperf_G00000126530 [Anoplocephala perfoliata]
MDPHPSSQSLDLSKISNDSPNQESVDSSTSALNSSTPIRCRICYDDKKNLISPCRCKGTVGLLHKPCLERWLQISQKVSCEICGYKYNLRPKPPLTTEEDASSVSAAVNQHDFLQEWLHSRLVKRNVITDCIFLAVLIPITCIGVYVCLITGLYFLRTEGVGSWQIPTLLTISTILLVIFLAWVGLAIRYHLRAYLCYRRQREDAIREVFYRQALERNWRFSVQPRPRGSSFTLPTSSTPNPQLAPLFTLNEDSEFSLDNQIIIV